MTVTLITVGSTAVATIQRPDGGAMDENGVISGGEFGIEGTNAYFDPNGATIGEAASLGYSGTNGLLFLKSGTVNDATHLMALRQRTRTERPSASVDHDSRARRQGARAAWMLDAPAFDDARQRVRALRVSAKIDHDSQQRRQRGRADWMLDAVADTTYGVRREARAHLLSIEVDDGAASTRRRARLDSPSLALEGESASVRREARSRRAGTQS